MPPSSFCRRVVAATKSQRQGPRYWARIGGMLAAPATTIRALRAAPAGQGARDVFWLVLLQLVIGDLASLVRAFLRGHEVGYGYTLGAVMAIVGHILPDLLVIVVGGLALTVFTRRAAHNSDEATPYDLAAYAWVPYLAVQIAFSIVGGGLGLAGLWPASWSPAIFDRAAIVLGIGCGVAVWSLTLWILLGEPKPAALPRSASLAGVGLLLLLALLAVSRGRQVASHWSELSAMATPKGTEAPAVDLPLLTGGRFVLEKSRGKAVFLDFWATWCGPCRRELPSLMRLSDRFGARGLEVIAVNTEGVRARQAIERFVAETQLRLPVALDDGEVSGRYRVDTIPHGVLVDPTGRVAKIFVGAASESSLTEAVEAVLPKQ